MYMLEYNSNYSVLRWNVLAFIRSANDNSVLIDKAVFRDFEIERCRTFTNASTDIVMRATKEEKLGKEEGIGAWSVNYWQGQYHPL
jgi:hypothetical protein